MAVTDQQALQSAIDNRAGQQAYASQLELLNVYQRARTQNLTAARGIPTDAAAQLDQLIGLCDTVVGVGQTIMQIVPSPKAMTGGSYGSVLDPSAGYQRQLAYSQDFVTRALQAQQQIVDGQLAKVGTLPADIAAAALAGTVVERPGNATDAMVSDRKQDLAAILQGASDPNVAAQGILHAAVKAGDDLTLYCLTGAPMAFTLQAIKGVRQATLQRVSADARVQNEPRSADPLFLGSKVSGYAFVKLQDGDQACAKLPDLAKAYTDGMLAAALAVWALPTVKAARTA